MTRMGCAVHPNRTAWEADDKPVDRLRLPALVVARDPWAGFSTVAPRSGLEQQLGGLLRRAAAGQFDREHSSNGQDDDPATD